MKKFSAILIIAILSSLSSFAQQIKYEKSLAIAKEKAKKENKILFIYIYPPQDPFNNKVNKEIFFPDAVEKFNNTFVNYKAEVSDSLLSPIIYKYAINTFPALLFFESNGGILAKEYGIYQSSSKYLELANKVLEASKQKTLSKYEEEYKAGNVDKDFLKEYIIKKQQLRLLDNASLIEQYVEKLKISDFNNYDEVLFILKAGPKLNG